MFHTNLGRVFVAMQVRNEEQFLMFQTWIVKDADVATAAIRGCMGDKNFHLQVESLFSLNG